MSLSDEHHETAERSDGHAQSSTMSEPSSQLTPTVIVTAVIQRNNKTGSWEGGPSVPCIGEASMVVYGESGHWRSKKDESRVDGLSPLLFVGLNSPMRQKFVARLMLDFVQNRIVERSHDNAMHYEYCAIAVSAICAADGDLIRDADKNRPVE